MQWELGMLAAAVVLFTTAALVFDLRTRKIPNWLTVGSLAMALVYHVGTAQLAGLGTALAGFGVGFGILFVLWLIGGGGGGDVKLMGALGAWLGPWLIMIVFMLSGVFTLVALVTVFMWRLTVRTTSPAYAASDGQTVVRTKADTDSARRMIPYAVPATVATWALLAVKALAFAAQAGR